jgi:hypothetical protein
MTKKVFSFVVCIIALLFSVALAVTWMFHPNYVDPLFGTTTWVECLSWVVVIGFCALCVYHTYRDLRPRTVTNGN